MLFHVLLPRRSDAGGCMKKIIETQRAPGAIDPYVQGVD
ncbi:reactive intermediate/imine deaminase, partial [Salmonella enterica]|nr:reactive intermediate/imine deaminase [Salmonella enterica]